jgi:prevent-host-death family protein
MVKTLEQAKAKLGALVSRAARGEEIIITVRGKPKARISRVASTNAPRMRGWIRELRALHRACASGRKPSNGEAILRELREERV